MKTKLIGNPYYCYILSFGLAFFIYSWGWSEIYPKLTIEVILFLTATFVIAFVIGKKINSKLYYENIKASSKNRIIVIFIFVSYLLEFIYNGGIPIIFLYKGIDISYMDFGIPTFHVILHTFCSFYTIYIFHQYISNKNKRLLILVFILITPNILIINRGAIIMTLSACMIIYLLGIRKILIRRLLAILISLAVFFFGFGYLGNNRSFNGDSMAFPRVTQATSDFVDSYIPKEFYWFYIYASSPFANFQNATISNIKYRYDIGGFITWELLPDFISKRIIPIESDYDGTHRLEYSINPILTVGSIYFEPFIRLGWYGPVSIFLFYILFIYCYLKGLSRNSKYFISALAILCVISVFNMFENMLNFSGLIFQLVYPMFFSFLDKCNIKFVDFNPKRLVFCFFNKRIRIL